MKYGLEIRQRKLGIMKDEVIIIAEAGVNHNGELDTAKKLVKEAALAGANYIKFQTFKTNKIVSQMAKQADYQLKNLKEKNDSQFEMLKKLEMPETWYKPLLNECQKWNIKFLSTAFDHESIDFLHQLNMDFFKIPSGEITNKPYLEYIASKNLPVVLSTGMADLSEIQSAINVLSKKGLRKDDIIVLHCNTEYPTPMEHVNLKAMNSIGDELGVVVGYSDHTLGIEVPIAAVSLGATVIEKHFTLNKNMPGPDHKASLEPSELKAMVLAIRNIELALSGSQKKEPSPSELANKKAIRKSLFFKKDLAAGEVVAAEDFIALRPGNGISPMMIDNYIGKRLSSDVTSLTMVDDSFFI